jgi:hypothetical protein
MRLCTRRARLGLVGVFATLGLAAGACGPSSNGTPVANAAGVWVEVSPATITAGGNVFIRADCGDNSNVASVKSEAFGTLTLHPWDSLLQAQTNVPGMTPAATFDVRLECATGSTANTTLTVLGNAASVPSDKAAPSKGPATGGGYLADRSFWQATRDSLSGPVGWFTAAAIAFVSAGVFAALTVRRRPVTRRRR